MDLFGAGKQRYLVSLFFFSRFLGEFIVVVL